MASVLEKCPRGMSGTVTYKWLMGDQYRQSGNADLSLGYVVSMWLALSSTDLDVDGQ